MRSLGSTAALVVALAVAAWPTADCRGQEAIAAPAPQLAQPGPPAAMPAGQSPFPPYVPPANVPGPSSEPPVFAPAGIPADSGPSVALPPATGPAPDLALPGAAVPDQAKGRDAFDSGMGGMGGFGGMGGAGGMLLPVDSVRYATTWLPSVPVQGQAADWQAVSQDLRFSHPLWSGDAGLLSVTGGVGNESIQTEAILPDTSQPYPAELWKVSMGLQYGTRLWNDWIAGGGVNVGSASDHPFAGIAETNVGANAMLAVPQGEHNAWLFFLAYSPTNELNFPIPMVAFNYNPSPEFHALIGLPFQVTWRPNEQWQFEASYMLIHTIHAKALYRFTKDLGAFAAYDWSNEAYTLLDRPDDKDRFFIYDQRVSLGLQARFYRAWTASASAGYVFDRYSFQGTSFAATQVDYVSLGNGPFAALNLGVRF